MGVARGPRRRGLSPWGPAPGFGPAAVSHHLPFSGIHPLVDRLAHHSLEFPHGWRVGPSLADAERPRDRHAFHRGAGKPAGADPLLDAAAGLQGVAQAAVDEIEHHLVPLDLDLHVRSEEPTSELQSLMRKSYAVFC